MPVEVVKKVPADQCEEVPGVKCFFELVDVEQPVCHEVPVNRNVVFIIIKCFFSIIFIVFNGLPRGACRGVLR